MSTKVMDLTSKLHEKTKETLAKLDFVWDEIGLDDKTREQRHQMFFNYVEELYNDMLLEAESCKSTLLEDMKAIESELCTIKRDLRLDISVDKYENVPLYIAKQSMKFELEKLQKLYDKKKTEIKDLILNQKNLCEALGKKPRELVISPLPTDKDISEFQSHLEELSNLKFTREEEFLKLKSRITTIMDELKIKPSLDFERNVVICEDSAFKVTDENMIQLQKLHKSLENQLQETKIKIAELREQVSHMWERLEESPQVRSDFLEANSGNSVNTLLELKAELRRLNKKKEANIKLFVDKLREELAMWWKKCYFTKEDQDEFLYYHSDLYTEDILTLHELQVEKMKTHYEKNIAIYNLYDKHENLWEKMLELEHRASEPNRFKNRGGQLLNEEKERKAIAVQLPKIESELLELVKEYEANNGKPFLIFHKPVEELLNKAWENHKENKKIKLSVKRKLREQVTTPSKSLFTQSSTKRKLFAPGSESSKRSRIEGPSMISKSASKLPSSASKSKSMDIQRRLKKIQKRDHVRKLNDTNYELFENELESKSSFRSTIIPERVLRSTSKTMQSTNGTPRKPLLVVNNTPHRTPLKGLRPKSPTVISNRLAVPSNNLPIII